MLGAGDSVYIGGEFTTVNGQQRAAIAKLDLATGQLVLRRRLDRWAPNQR